MNIQELKEIIDNTEIVDDTIKNQTFIKKVKGVVKKIIDDNKDFFGNATIDSVIKSLENQEYTDEYYIRNLDTLLTGKYDFNKELYFSHLLEIYNKIFTYLRYTLEDEYSEELSLVK